MQSHKITPSFVNDYAELLSDKVGGSVLGCSDQWFAPCVNLIKHTPPVWDAQKFVDTGKWMDGWETRRHNPDHDWAILKLGISGIIKGFEIDTAYFTGNYPPFASIEAICDDSEPTFEQLSNSAKWTEILHKSDLTASNKHFFKCDSTQRWTHLKFHIYPDGGVARLRVFGVVSRDWSLLIPGELVDLAAIENGGVVVDVSDNHYGGKFNIIMPGRAINMGDGWETRRSRGTGDRHDWLIVKLGAIGSVKRIEVDTNWFKGNFPTNCSIEGYLSPSGVESVDLLPSDIKWTEILPKTPCTAHHRHFFQRELTDTTSKFSHIRLKIYPDGGVSRLRIHCHPDIPSSK
eukprot:gene4317-5403_t